MPCFCGSPWGDSQASRCCIRPSQAWGSGVGGGQAGDPRGDPYPETLDFTGSQGVVALSVCPTQSLPNSVGAVEGGNALEGHEPSHASWGCGQPLQHVRGQAVNPFTSRPALHQLSLRCGRGLGGYLPGLLFRVGGRPGHRVQASPPRQPARTWRASPASLGPLPGGWALTVLSLGCCCWSCFIMMLRFLSLHRLF